VIGGWRTEFDAVQELGLSQHGFDDGGNA